MLQKVSNQNDESAWKEFVFYYEKYIYLVCRSTNLDHHDAEEIVQQVLVKLWKKLPEFHYNRNQRFRSWLCQVTRNCVMDHFRKIQQQQSRLEKAYASQHWQYYKEDSLPDLEKIAEREWENYIVNMALRNLKNSVSEKMVEVFLAREDGVSAKEISIKMGIPVNTVYVYQKRMTTKLAEEIQQLCAQLD